MKKIKIIQGLKNIVGYQLDYGSCPITGNTYWRTKTVTIPYSEKDVVRISLSALDDMPSRAIAWEVLALSKNMFANGRRYNLTEIKESVERIIANLIYNGHRFHYPTLDRKLS